MVDTDLEYVEENRLEEFMRACNEIDKVYPSFKMFIDTQYKALILKTLHSKEGMSLETSRAMAEFLKTILITIKKNGEIYRERIKKKGL